MAMLMHSRSKFYLLVVVKGNVNQLTALREGNNLSFEKKEQVTIVCETSLKYWLLVFHPMRKFHSFDFITTEKESLFVSCILQSMKNNYPVCRTQPSIVLDVFLPTRSVCAAWIISCSSNQPHCNLKIQLCWLYDGKWRFNGLVGVESGSLSAEMLDWKW